ncbi:guanylate kinase [Aurantiacibacter xanthus]|uniref:Guanylate kinase n=1 Tax=Aurantiacibacter xanthus TaxID=1784712 RepID=A0A3A1P842_9SPHN|nr:guanylate kinase [Aurantiacibacter xanthus]RIV89908.1 guanylate kinase [Aurantiacibacter xanthus]
MTESETLPRRGLMFILSSPSGAGKTTIARKLLAAEQSLAMSVSVTTRPIRPGETEGKDYFFTQRPQFDRMVEAGDFLEWAEVFGNCYGTPRAQISEGLAAGQDYLFDIDWQGAQQLSQAAGPDVVSVFLLPPSIGELEHRLRSRGTDSDEVIRGRMDRARAEISHWDAYDYVLVNENVDACFEQVRTILHAERLKRERQRGLIEFARELMR